MLVTRVTNKTVVSLTMNGHSKCSEIYRLCSNTIREDVQNIGMTREYYPELIQPTHDLNSKRPGKMNQGGFFFSSCGTMRHSIVLQLLRPLMTDAWFKSYLIFLTNLVRQTQTFFLFPSLKRELKGTKYKDEIYFSSAAAEG